MSEVLELTTSHHEVADLVDELAPFVDDTSIQLPIERQVDDGEWVRFDVKLADGSSVLEGIGRCAGSVLVGGSSHRVRLTLLQFDMRNEIMFERIVLAREAIDGGESTGKIDLAELGAGYAGRTEPKPPPPPPRARPPAGPPARPKSVAPPKRALPPRPLPPPPTSAPPPLPLKRGAAPAPGVHGAETSVARPIDGEKTSVAPPPTRREPRGGGPAVITKASASASEASTVPDAEPAPRSNDSSLSEAAPAPPVALPSVPKPSAASSSVRSAAPASPEPVSVPEPASSPDPVPAAEPPRDPEPAVDPEPVAVTENTAPQEIATLDTVVSRVVERRPAPSDGVRLDIPQRLVDRAHALAPTLPEGVTRTASRASEAEAVLHAAVRLGLASLAALADADDDDA